MASKRLYEIDRVKAFAIVLVVVGHLVTLSGAPPENNEWYMTLQYAIYKFHMPLFMFISGMIFFYTYKPVKSISEYLDWVIKKAFRLMPGFILFGLLIYFGKLLVSGFIHVDNVHEGFSRQLIALLLYPSNSASGSLWFIYVLFEYYLIFPLLLIFFRSKYIVLLLIALSLNITEGVVVISNMFLANRFLEYLIYFSLGIYAIKHYDTLQTQVVKYKLLYLLAFFASYLVIFYSTEPFSKLIIGLMSIPAAFAVIGSYKGRGSEHLLIISEYTFTIYLMNTIFIGILKGVMFKFMGWDGLNFILFFILLLLAGVYLPIFAHKYVLSKVKYLSVITK